MNIKKALTLALLLFVNLQGISLAGEVYVVQSGDSLWKLAAKTKAPDVTVHQMIAAIHDMNSAVLGADIGSIRPGMKLTIPSASEATNANSKRATALLDGSAINSSLTRNERIENIQNQINRIETEINQAVQAVQASQGGFEIMIKQ